MGNRVGMSQSEFATLLGVSVRTLLDWDRAVANRRVLRKPCCALRRRIRRRSKRQLELKPVLLLVDIFDLSIWTNDKIALFKYFLGLVY